MVEPYLINHSCDPIDEVTPEDLCHLRSYAQERMISEQHPLRPLAERSAQILLDKLKCNQSGTFGALIEETLRGDPTKVECVLPCRHHSAESAIGWIVSLILIVGLILIVIVLGVL